jgi:glycerophosphoryl diester phosphodiesterase
VSLGSSLDQLEHRGRVPAVRVAVVADRGSHGFRPEHTLEGYRLAIRMGADEIALELVSSSDGVLVARHESDLGATTDIAAHPEFADRGTTRQIDGSLLSGWFVEEFTLAELKRLTARERSAELWPASAAYDGMCGIPTFNEVLAMVRAESVRAGRRVGVVAELRNAAYAASLGLPLDRPLLADLRRHCLDHAHSRVTVTSTETAVLRELAPRTKVSVVQLLDPAQAAPPPG